MALSQINPDVIATVSQINFFVELFAIQIFFKTHVHLGTLTFQKNLNQKNFLEKLDLRDSVIASEAWQSIAKRSRN